LPELAFPDIRKKPLPIRAISQPARKDLEVVQTNSGKLTGKRFLIVEDEPLVALLQTDILTSEGADIVASVANVKEAPETIERAHFDAALLDGNLRGHPVDEVAAALTRNNVPFLFVSGYGATSLPTSFRDVPLLAKPFTQEELIEAASRLVAKNSASFSLRKM
jgi:CheY-like chemotaxis protein